MTASSSAPNLVASTSPDVEASTFGPRRQPSPPYSVEIPVHVLHGIIDDLSAVSVALRTGPRGPGDQDEYESDPALEEMDRIVARIRQSVRTSTGIRVQAGVLAETIATGQTQQPDITALSSVPNSELPTIELLDAAHSARRALIALEHATGPEACHRR